MINENDVIDAIYALLADLDELQHIYKAIPNEVEGYPNAFIIPVSWEDEFADTRDTVVNAVFKIVVTVELGTDMMAAQDSLRDAVVAVRETLSTQENITLGNIVDSSRLTSGQYLFDTKEAKVGYCEIEYRVRKRFNRFA